jgi:hypothetical protein
MIRAVVLVKEEAIENLLFSGNILCSPVTALEEVEGLLEGVALDEDQIRERVKVIYGKSNYQLTGTTPEDLARLVLEAGRKAI